MQHWQQHASGEPDQAGEIKVLVVDDSMSMRQTLEWILAKNYVVETAVNGLEGIEKYGSFKPDVMLLDIVMPDMDGFRVVEHIRKAIADRDTFIIMLTAEESQEYKLRALDLGANDFLYKPFDRTELLARIGVAERQVRLTHQLRSSMEQIKSELNLVARLQGKLLPQMSPYFAGVRLESLYRPSGQASGDYFDYFLVSENVIRVVIADVSGHGARAAFLMAIVRTLFRTTTTHYLELGATLQLVNSHLNQIIGKEDDFVTCFAGDIDLENKTLRYCNCGHTPALLKNAAGGVQYLPPYIALLGFFDLDFKVMEQSFSSGCELFLFTDGFYEWQPTPGKPLELERFCELAEKSFHKQGNFLENLMEELSFLTKTMPRFKDDLTALWVHVERDND